MKTIQLNVSNDIYDKVLTVIESLPKNRIKLQLEKKDSNSLVEFFQSSPLVGKVSLKRNNEVYENRM